MPNYFISEIVFSKYIIKNNFNISTNVPIYMNINASFVR